MGQHEPQKLCSDKNSALIVKHHCNQSKYAISEESDEPNSKF